MAETERWQSRLRAAKVGLPVWARDRPERCVYRSNATGTWEIHAWDRSTDTHRQVTERANGTLMGTIDPSGRWLWWFADTDGDEFGVWMCRPFDGDTDRPAVPGLEPAYPAGLALGAGGLAVVGRTGATGSSVVLCRPGADPVPLYRHREDAQVVALSADDSLVAIGHSEHGDSRHPALRVLAVDGSTVADLWDGPGLGLKGVGFAPVPGDARLLVEHERRGRPELLIWDTVSGAQRELVLDLPGETGADWYPTGDALLISHSHHARDELHRYDLASGELSRIPTPRGTIGSATVRAAAVRPDGSVEFAWSSAAEPQVIRSTAGHVVLAPPGPAAPPSVPVEDAWVEGPGGPVHALISRPPGGVAPYACVFEVHGGPTGYDADAFDPLVAAWVDHGFAVVQVNYRGSTGYGSAWRDAIEGRPGLTELEDVKAVRDWAVATGLADPDRLVLAGRSWGGYLTLLGLGLHPGDWTVGISNAPVADYLTAYQDEMEALKAYDRSLFGGSPEEVPERYLASSPLTYVEAVSVPVLVIAGENDPRCPIRQIDNYVNRLAELGKEHEVHRYDAGHGSLVAAERVRHLAATIGFARKHIGDV
ncbi:prolyl oligopeptidase family serine peptidase [Kitasatospora sp. CMC57]|uniref:Prolyl oligopeptidase family serine peptidase n=1 Tax=Kitasatospora sp. CMC57 TaxID=3231513 RepID=A0AB33K370_9ACTN